MYQPELWSHLKTQLGKDLFLSSLTEFLAGFSDSWAIDPCPPPFPYYGVCRAVYSMHQSYQVREQKRVSKTEAKILVTISLD